MPEPPDAVQRSACCRAQYHIAHRKTRRPTSTPTQRSSSGARNCGRVGKAAWLVPSHGQQGVRGHSRPTQQSSSGNQACRRVRLEQAQVGRHASTEAHGSAAAPRAPRPCERPNLTFTQASVREMEDTIPSQNVESWCRWWSRAEQQAAERRLRRVCRCPRALGNLPSMCGCTTPLRPPCHTYTHAGSTVKLTTNSTRSEGTCRASAMLAAVPASTVQPANSAGPCRSDAASISAP